MLPNVNLSIALAVFMGIASGGLLSLVLMAPRRQQTSFSVMFGLALLLATLGAIGSASTTESFTAGLVNGVVLLVLSIALGYILTTYSVLSRASRRPDPPQVPEWTDKVGVVLLAQGEPPDYDVHSAICRFELADDRQDVPPPLLRPFYMRDLKWKYASAGLSPARQYYLDTAARVQSRLDSRHQVYTAFYSDLPTYVEAVRAAVEDGSRRIVVAHIRATDPPDAIISGEPLEPLRLDALKVKLVQLGPLSNAGLLAHMYVRRFMEAGAQMLDDPDKVGVLLVGRGHPAGQDASENRMHQETEFLAQVRLEVLKVGFDDARVLTGWLRYGTPSLRQAVATLAAEGCQVVYWAPVSFPADGVNTLYDIPAQIGPEAARSGITLVPLGAWNADDLAAQELASRVSALSRAAVPVGELVRDA